MKVILLQDIKNLGKKYDVREISDGYGRNFLIPQKLAKIATEELIGEIKKQKETLAEEGEKLKNSLEKTAKILAEKEFHFYPTIGEKGEIFSSVTKKEIKEAFEKALPFETELKKKILKKTKLNLNKSLKTLGLHEVGIDLGQDINFKIKVVLNQLQH